MTDQTPAGLAAAIGEARQRLLGFAERCPDAGWRAAPVDGDPRPVGVIVDHVADAYEYLAGFIRDLIESRPVTVTGLLIDELNADHAARAGTVARQQATAHLRDAGDSLISLVAGLTAGQLDAGDGRVSRFAEIAARHADSHRSELEEALADRGGHGPGE